jgi:hypothetical protein
MAEIVEIPEEVGNVWGEPPLLPTEDPEAYRKLAEGAAKSIRPKDMIAWLWVKDVADLSTEIWRLRRWKSRLLTASSLVGKSLASAPKSEFVDAEETTLALVESNFDLYAKIDSLMASAELRRAATLREVERHNDALSSRLQRSSREIIEAEIAEDHSPSTASSSLLLIKKPTLVTPTEGAPAPGKAPK